MSGQSCHVSHRHCACYLVHMRTDRRMIVLLPCSSDTRKVASYKCGYLKKEIGQKCKCSKEMKSGDTRNEMPVEYEWNYKAKS